MPTDDDIAAQQALLRAHRQTLGLLLMQQAQIGAAYTPPAIANGIRAARDAIMQAKSALRGWGVSVEDLPDDADVPGAPAVGAPYRPQTGAPTAGGDVITANVGAGALGVAVGKNIRQEIAAIPAADPDDDRRAIAGLLARLEGDLAAAQIDAATARVAAREIRLLAGELAKTGERAAPSASAIAEVGDALLDDVPPLRAALTALFTSPPVLRALRRADAPLDAWLQRRFGG
ncbi:MAG TPA: hypothetical protein VF897_14625 [Roseiflexaceae bacterium]